MRGADSTGWGQISCADDQPRYVKSSSDPVTQDLLVKPSCIRRRVFPVSSELVANVPELCQAFLLFPHFFVWVSGFWFCIPWSTYSCSSYSSSAPLFVTHTHTCTNLAHTHTRTTFSHSHATLSHTTSAFLLRGLRVRGSCSTGLGLVACLGLRWSPGVSRHLAWQVTLMSAG